MSKPAVLVPLALSVSMFVCGPVMLGAQQQTATKTAVNDSGLENAPWAIDMQKRRAALVARNGPGTDAALRLIA